MPRRGLRCSKHSNDLAPGGELEPSTVFQRVLQGGFPPSLLSTGGGGEQALASMLGHAAGGNCPIDYETLPYQILAPLEGHTAGTRLEAHQSLFAIFPSLIPTKPYCTDFHSEGLIIRSRKKALEFRHLQLNGPNTYAWITFDVDRDDAYRAADDAGLKAPNVISVNPRNGHGHLSYLLATPVHRYVASRRKPLEFYAGVERGYRRRLCADRGYSGLIVKNPLHLDWRTEWQALKPYTLEDLDCELDFKDKAPELIIEREIGAGRNVTVFDNLRRLAYQKVRAFKPTGNFAGFHRSVLDLAMGLNMQFYDPLREGEVRAIAKSVAKWTWRHFSMEGFSAIQRERVNRRYVGRSQPRHRSRGTHSASRAPLISAQGERYSVMSTPAQSVDRERGRKCP